MNLTAPPSPFAPHALGQLAQRPSHRLRKWADRSSGSWARLALADEPFAVEGLLYLDEQLYMLRSGAARPLDTDASEHGSPLLAASSVPPPLYPPLSTFATAGFGDDGWRSVNLVVERFDSLPASAAWNSIDGLLRASSAARRDRRRRRLQGFEYGRLLGCPSETQVLNIGIVVDPGFTSRAGGRSPALAELYVIMNNINGLFEDQLGVRLQVAHAIINDGTLSYVEGGPGNGPGPLVRPPETGVPVSVGDDDLLLSGPSALLGHFSQWAAEHGPPGAQLWHLLTDLFPPAGVTGVAWTGAACTGFSRINYSPLSTAAAAGEFPRTVDGRRVSRYSLVVPMRQNTCSADQVGACSGPTGLTSRSYSTWLTMAHELGHSLGGAHTFGLGGRMSYSSDIQFVPNLPGGKTDICENLANMRVISGCLAEEEPECGNGRLDSGEECDDGNRNNADGCSWHCVVECGYVCAQSSSGLTECSEHCGDGIVQLEYGEQCDDSSACCGEDCRLAEGAHCSGGECCGALCAPLGSNTSCAAGLGFCHGGECDTEFARSIGTHRQGGSITRVDTVQCPVAGCELLLALNGGCWRHASEPERHALPDGHRCVDVASGNPGMCMSGNCSATATPIPVCGDGIVSGDEQCDDDSACCAGCRLVGTCSPPGECCESSCEMAPAPVLCSSGSGFCDRGSCRLRSSECIAMNMRLDLTMCPLSNSLPCIVPCAQSAAVVLPLAGDDGETPSTCYNSGALRDGTPCQLPQHVDVRGLCVQGECVEDNSNCVDDDGSAAPLPPPPPAPYPPGWVVRSPPPPGIIPGGAGDVDWTNDIASWFHEPLLFGLPFGPEQAYSGKRWILLLICLGLSMGLCFLQRICRLILWNLQSKKRRPPPRLLLDGDAPSAAAVNGAPAADEPAVLSLSETLPDVVTLELPEYPGGLTGETVVESEELRRLSPRETQHPSSSNLLWQGVGTDTVAAGVSPPPGLQRTTPPNAGALSRARASNRRRNEDARREFGGAESLAASAQVSEVQAAQQNLEMLKSMGFDEVQAATALASTNGSLPEAVAILTSNDGAQPPSDLMG